MADGDLRAIFREHLPKVHWQAIETSITGRGVPDVNGCWASTEFWVECKFTAGWAVRIRPEQVAWLGRRGRAGGLAFVAVRRKVGGGPKTAPADELWLYNGHRAGDLAKHGMKRVLPIGCWTGGPARWCWPAVLTLLIRR